MDEHEDIFFKIESEEEGLKDEVRDVVTGIKENEFNITEVEGAFYLVYLKSVLPPYTKFIDEVKDEIHSKVWKKKFEERFSEWLKELFEESIVKYYD